MAIDVEVVSVAGRPETELPRAAASSIPEQYREVRRASEVFCAPLAAEDCVVQSMPDVSPTKWHLAHVSWFFETFLLGPALAGYAPLDPRYTYLFNSYYETIGKRHCRPRRGLISRPTVEETYRYRAWIDEHMQGLLARLQGEDSGRLEELITLGVHHEQQHQELMVTDIKHVLACNPLHPIYLARPQLKQERVPHLDWVPHEGGIYWTGHEGEGFAFDNEGPRHQELLRPFEIGSRLVTNGDYLAFIEDAGYRRPDLWLSAGWGMVQEGDWQAPLYWEKEPGHWWTTSLSGLREVEESEPVCHVSYFEADAYARWAGARLPSEAEWEVAAEDVPVSGPFAESGRYHPMALSSAYRDGRPTQMFGDVWQWTQSSYSPYPGFKPAAGAIGEYNGKFMCNQYVLRGASCATPSSHARRTYRNFFPPDARWQFSGIRLARDA